VGLFALERKPDSTGIATRSDGYYLLYNGNYVMRQQADGTLVRFETQDANFNPDYFEVLNNANQSVRAKFLKYNGEYILNSNGNPYIAPYTFDFEAFIAKYKSLAISPSTEGYIEYTSGVLFTAFRPGGIDDLQRSYDGGQNRPFAISFTATASLAYGAASSIMGLDIDTCIWAGGLINKAQNWFGANNDISGEADNNPNNPPNIRSGYNFVDSLRTPTSRFNKADTNNNTYDLTLPNSSETTTNPVPTTPDNKPVSSAADSNNLVNFASSTFDQKWQYNFQINLGPTNPAFAHGEPIDGYLQERNPNGVLWNVNAAGIPTAYDFDKYVEQQRIIERTTNQTITEMQNESGLPIA
jgi:hypothetical protein